MTAATQTGWPGVNPSSHHPQVTLIRGDSIDALRKLPDNSADAIVTDPPYGMSKAPDIAEVLKHWLAGDDYQHRGAGFMGKTWDSFVPGPAVWRECFRVLKPGGHLLAFAAPRTVDLMGISLRLGGFEFRDSILYWGFGTGFPKSMNVAKAIDKAAGRDAAKAADALKMWRTAAGLSRGELAKMVGCTPASISDWEEGRVRTKGKPPEFLVPSPKYQSRLNELCSYGTDARTIQAWSQGRTGDGTVLGLGHSGAIYGPASSDLAKQWEGWGTSLKPAYEPILMVRKPVEGTVVNNVLAHGTGAINVDASRIPTSGDLPGRFPTNVILSHSPDCELVGTKTVRSNGHHPASRGPGGLSTTGHTGQEELAERAAGSEDVESWDCQPGCPVSTLDTQSGVLKSGKSGVRSSEVNMSAAYGAESRKAGDMVTGFGDVGGASRFFYCAKASKSERNVGLSEGTTNTHPTVKPVKLMGYLVNLVTPPGGVLLDPFCGSGTTLVAAVQSGFDCIGIDRDDEDLYLEITSQRVTHAGGHVVRSTHTKTP